METLVTFSLDDTSPCVSYSPFGDTFSSPNLIGGWNPYFTSSGYAKSQGDVGVGTSLHITSLDGAALQIQWRGTGITLMGNATQANYSVTLDGQVLSQPETASNVLADIQNLTDSTHTVKLTAQIPQSENPPNSSMLVFDQAILYSSPFPVADNIGFQNQTLDDQDIAFLGRWSITSPNGGYEFHTTSTIGDQAIATFNGTTFLMLGQTSPSSGNYSVQLDNTTTQFSARSSFTQSDSLLFFATDLDPAVLHTVTVKNTDGGDLSLLINGFKSVVPSPIPSAPANTTPPATSTTAVAASSASSAFPEGTIAAFALAGILAFILIAGGLFFLLVYRPRRRRRRAWAASMGRTRTPKEQEAVAGVLDIAPADFDDKSDGSGDHMGSRNGGGGGGSGQNPKEAQRKRWSALSGFQKWRREAVRGSFGGLSLGIRFRHSDSANGRSSGANGNGVNGGFSDSGRPSSAPTSLPSSSESARRARAKRKGKGRHVSGMSWTPSITVDLPMGGQQRQGHGAGPAPRVAWVGGLSAFAAANLPPSRAGPLTTQLKPPSYAASVSNDSSPRDSRSAPSSLIPRSVSESSPAAHHAALDAYARSRLHGDRALEETHTFLLHEGSPETGVSGSWAADRAPTPATPPIRPLPSSAQYQQPRPRAPTPPTSTALALAQAAPAQAISRQIIHPRLIDTSLLAVDLDDPRIEEPHIMRDVLRGLSPRTSRSLPAPPPQRRAQPPTPHDLVITPAPPGAPRSPDDAESPESVTSPTRRLLPEDEPSRWFSDGPRVSVKPLPRTPTSSDVGEQVEVRDGVFLDVNTMSPFRLEFEDNSAGTSIRPLPPTASDDARSHTGGVSTDESISDPALSMTTAESTFAYKPARDTFGAASTVQSGLNRHSSSRSGNTSASGNPFRLSDFVQGSSRQPFRLETVSSQDASSEQLHDAASPSDPSPANSDGVVSFLDFTSSHEGSLRVPSDKSRKKKRTLPAPPAANEPKSRWSNTTVPSVATGPEAGGDHAHESSGESQKAVSPPSEGRSTDSSTFPIPVRVTIPPSPYHIMDAERSGSNAPSQHSSSNAHNTDPLHVHPVLENIESPTESLPISTSEIRFRHPSDSEEGHQARRAVLPLEDSRREQRSSMPDMADLPEEYRPRPFDPNVLVNRVLGFSSPTSPTTPRANHSRSQSNVVISSSRTSLFPIISRNDASNDQLNNRPGQS